jgi:hypothetical protein
MENQLYIRLRGRVLGPYDTAKLQSLAMRGQLSRMHEVSPDSANWVPASNYPDLFTNAEIPQATVVQQAAQVAHQPVNGDQEYRLAGRRWWYRKNGSQVGPVEEAALQQSLASGTLSPEDFVWTEGMPQWVPARQAPHLTPTPASTTQQNDFSFRTTESGDNRRDLPIGLCKSARNSRPWVTFIAIVLFVYAGLSLVVGMLLLILGANRHLPPFVAQGLFGLIYGIDSLIGGSLLMSYANRLGNMRYGSQEYSLEKCLDTLRSFWLFVSINLIVFLGLLAFFAIWIIAFAGSAPWEL